MGGSGGVPLRRLFTQSPQSDAFHSVCQTGRQDYQLMKPCMKALQFAWGDPAILLRVGRDGPAR